MFAPKRFQRLPRETQAAFFLILQALADSFRCIELGCDVEQLLLDFQPG